MNLKVRNLQFRRGMCWFRSVIPFDLRHLYGRRVVTKCLYTSDLKAGILLCNIIGGELRKYFEAQIRNPMKQLTQDKANELLKVHLTALFQKVYRVASTRKYADNEAKMEALADCAESMNAYTDAANRNDMGIVSKEIQKLLDDNSYSLPSDSTELAYMCRKLIKGRFYLEKLQEDIITGSSRDTPETLISQTFEEGNIPVRIQEKREETASAGSTEKLNLGGLIDLYCNDKIASNRWASKTQRTAKAAFRIVREYFGADTPITNINHEKLVNFKTEILLKLPSNYKKHKEFDGKPLQEIVKDTTHKKMEVKTVNERLVLISSFFKWAALCDYIPKNPAQALIISDNTLPNKRRDPYSVEELRKILAIIRELPPKKISNYWIIILGLFTGLRQNEICQLYLEDIKVIDGITCVDVNNDGDKKIKNKFSKRIVPLHPILSELGFMEYHKDRVKSKSVRLFPDQPKDRDDKYAQKFQRWYHELNKFKITPKGKSDFHSLRKNMGNALKQNGEQLMMINEILGHEPDKSSTSIYVQEYNIKNKYEAISKLDHGLDVVKILGEAEKKT